MKRFMGLGVRAFRVYRVLGFLGLGFRVFGFRVYGWRGTVEA